MVYKKINGLMDPTNVTAQMASDVAPENPLVQTMDEKWKIQTMAKQAFFDTITDARLRKALGTNARETEGASLKQGDEAEFCYEAKPGGQPKPWLGPAAVIDDTQITTKGRVHLRWQGQQVSVPIQNARPRLPYLWLNETVANSFIERLKQLVADQPANAATLHGYTFENGILVLTKATRKDGSIYALSKEVAATVWGKDNVLGAVRVAKGINKIQHPAGIQQATALWWNKPGDT